MPKWISQLSAAMLLACTVVQPAQAQTDVFHPGPVIPEFGQIAAVQQDVKIPANTVFKVAFDVSEAGKPGEINRTLESAARFINMHAEAGVKSENIRIAVVVHGKASVDVTNDAFYGARNDGAVNANAAAIRTLTQHGVHIYQCGQSAAAAGIAHADLLPGVEMALSAMTMHAILQQQGYTLNPF